MNKKEHCDQCSHKCKNTCEVTGKPIDDNTKKQCDLCGWKDWHTIRLWYGKEPHYPPCQ